MSSIRYRAREPGYGALPLMLSCLLGLGLPSCATTPDVEVTNQGDVIVSNLSEGLRCFRIRILREGFPPGPWSQIPVQGGRARLPVGTGPGGVTITGIEVAIDSDCSEMEDLIGEWSYTGEPLQLPPQGEVDVPWDDFEREE